MTSFNPFHAILGSLVAALAFSGAAIAATPTAPVPHGTVTLVSETTSLASQHENWIGLLFLLEPGWHTYWANPGDAGIAPKITWKLPPGFQAGAIVWPVPQRLPVGKLIDFGYEKDVTLLVPVRGAANAAPASAAEISAQLSVLVCKDLCIPGKAAVSLSIPVKATPPVPSNQNAPIFAAARSHLPKPLPAGSKVTATESKNEFLLSAETVKQSAHAFFFPLEQSQIDNVAPQPADRIDKGVRLHLKKSPDLRQPLTRLRGVLDLDGTGYQVDAPMTR